MDIQLPPMPPAASSHATTADTPSRIAQGETRHEPAKPGKSFSSELRAAHESRPESGRSQPNRDESEAAPSSDETAPAPHASSCETRDGHACDRISERPENDSETSASPVVNAVTIQRVLLALIAQPAVDTSAQPVAQTSSEEGPNSAMESVMPSVMEDGTSLPATAPDSSTFPQVGSKEMT